MPDKSEENREREKRSEGIKPDAIYVDDVQKQEPSGRRPDYIDSLQKIAKKKYPFFLRIVTLLAGIILLCWAVFVAFFQMVITFLAALFLFKADELNQMMNNLWKILCRVSAFSLSLFVATFSPGFGLGILSLYLMMQGESLETSFMGRVLKL